MLQSGGHMSLYDWTKSDADISEDMRYWFKMEGLTCSLESLDAFARHLASAGFVDIEIVKPDTSRTQQATRRSRCFVSTFQT